jgi:energy-coupling factor transporter transmembrane protein EcfT
MNTSSSSSSGIGAIGLLGCIFVTLKLLGKITWSWWWVTLPFWWWLLILPLVAFVYGFFYTVGSIKRRKQRLKQLQKDRDASKLPEDIKKKIV